MATAHGNGNSDGFELCKINLRVIAAAALFASKDENRYYLMGVCVEVEPRATTYIATDGHRMICHREDLAPEDDENRLTGAFIIPTRHCKLKLEKEDDGRAKMYLQHGRLTIAHNLVDVTFSPIEGVYPDWRKVIPRKPASGVIAQYNFKLLDDFRKFSKAQELPTPFLAPNGDGPAFIWFAGRPDVFGIMMPHRDQEQMHRKPQTWALRGGPEREQGDIEDDLLRNPELDEDEPEQATPPSGKSAATDTASAN